MPEVQDETTAAMDKKEVAKMLGYLKYHQSKSTAAAQALEKYKALPAQDKRAFLQQFGKNKKDLSWVCKIGETESTIDDSKNRVIDGWYNRHEVLKFNAFDGNDKILTDGGQGQALC